jgi:hypothetical protein
VFACEILVKNFADREGWARMRMLWMADRQFKIRKLVKGI